VKGEETPKGLAGRASRGDEESFAALCDVLKTKLFRTAKGVLGNETLALDAVSEAVFRAFKGIRRLREIISLKYYSGYTLSDISAILNIPEGTVKSRLNRALNLLRLEVSNEFLVIS